MKLFILHDNATWLKPIVAQLDALAVPFEAIDLGSGSVLELSAEPPAGLFFNRCSPSSHSRGKRYSMELAANYIAWLEAHGRTVINGSRAVALEASKVLQELQLRKFGVPSPRTALACGREQLAPALVEEFSQLLGGKKFLTKHNRAGSGLGVRLFETAAQATEYVQSDGYEESVDGLTLLQSFVEAPEQAHLPHAQRAFAVEEKRDQGLRGIQAVLLVGDGELNGVVGPLMTQRQRTAHAPQLWEPSGERL